MSDVRTEEGRGELRKRCEAATPGPWDFCACAGDPEWPIVVASGFGVVFNTGKGGASVGDSEFTAAARTALPLALDRIDELEREAVVMRAFITADGAYRAYEHAWHNGTIAEQSSDEANIVLDGLRRKRELTRKALDLWLAANKIATDALSAPGGGG